MICDGVHVNLRVVKLFAEILGSRLIVVSDACPAAGMGDGDFMLGSMPARVRGAEVTLRDGTLAGAVSLIDVGVANLIGAGIPLAAAVTAGTKTPADLLRTPELDALPLVLRDSAQLIQTQGSYSVASRFKVRSHQLLPSAVSAPMPNLKRRSASMIWSIIAAS